MLVGMSFYSRAVNCQAEAPSTQGSHNGLNRRQRVLDSHLTKALAGESILWIFLESVGPAAIEVPCPKTLFCATILLRGLHKRRSTGNASAMPTVDHEEA